jgi:predicted AAA+ superfamily ATPase
MSTFTRKYEETIKYWLTQNKVVILYGARQVGKSTILNSLKQSMEGFTILNCENSTVAEILSSNNMGRIKLLFGNYQVIALDEAQKIENIGSVLKQIHDSDEFKCKLIATGSSSFELSNKITEPLTGRNVKIRVYPYAIEEILENKSGLWLLENLDDLLVYGMYPEALNTPAEKRALYLENIAGDYLYQDILQHERLKNSRDLQKLLRALALQLGSQVSYNELGRLIGLSSKTVERYIDLLQKNFILIQLNSLSRNLRNELRKSKKIYFVDLGLRNALISNFNSIDSRTDVGALWENFCVLERLKANSIKERVRNLYFWRTYDQAEIDFIEEYGGELDVYEFKYNPKKKNVKIADSFMNAYPVRNVSVITRDNFEELSQ